MLSVIVCTYKRERYIYNVLESLAKNSLPFRRYEIIVVDNNPGTADSGTSAELDRFEKDWPQVCLRRVHEPTPGLSHARNRGISESRGQLLIFVDDDATVNEEYLTSYEELFARRADIMAAGGPVIPRYEGGSEPEWMDGRLRRLLTGYLYFGGLEKNFPAGYYPGGGNAAYRAEVFDKTGLYNVDLGRKGGDLGGGEEKDIFAKMKAAGMKYIYTPSSVLFHSIPDYKLGKEYLDRVTRGIGESERRRTLDIGKGAYAARLFKEVVKWGGTLVLALVRTLKGNPGCARRLIRFRFNVSVKLLGL